MTSESQTIPTGLYWQGKKTEVERIVLPFQTIETINESRATREKEKKTGAVAEKLGRRWIMADLGRFAIHTTRKRQPREMAGAIL